jgi:peptide chain release factor subunit 1
MQTTETANPSLAETLDRLGRLEPVTFPVISLYLDAQPDTRGKDHYGPFLKKELRGRLDELEPRSAERESFEKDMERIEQYVSEEVRPSANGIAIFACSGSGLFETLQLDAPIENNRLTVGDRPHLAPLARVIDRHPRHVVVLSDTNAAHVYVFGRGRTIDREDLESPKMSRTDAGGWSQMRYQRHVDNLHQNHAKELVETLGKIVAEERVDIIFLAGDEVIIPLLRSELTKELEQKVVGVLRLDIRTPEDDVKAAAAAALAVLEGEAEVERVERIAGEWRAGRLAVAGKRDVLKALESGQVEELVMSSSFAESGGNGHEIPDADDLAGRAIATSARIRFVENPDLLAELGGVAATLRYKPGALPRDNSPVERKVEA